MEEYMAQQNQGQKNQPQAGRSTSPDVNSASQQKDFSTTQKGSQWSDSSDSQRDEKSQKGKMSQADTTASRQSPSSSSSRK